CGPTGPRPSTPASPRRWPSPPCRPAPPCRLRDRPVTLRIWHSRPSSANEVEKSRSPPGGATMNLKPLEDRIVVRAQEAEETTTSGLVIPDTAKEKPQQGDVLAVGPGRRSDQTGDLIPVDVAVGDVVVYSKYGGTEITVDGEDLLILTSRDVLAKVAK